MFLFFATALFLFRSVSCVEFVYNSNFTTTNTILLGATVTSPPSILTFANQAPAPISRALYPTRISAASSASPIPFATSFIFSLSLNQVTSPVSDFDLSFVFLSSSETSVATFAVEFDTFFSKEFKLYYNNVSVSVKSDYKLTSVSSAIAGFYGENYQAWIEFNGSAINVTMARAGSSKPRRPLINIPLNLSGVLLDDMFVGFTGCTGGLVQSHRIFSWSFSNSNFSIGDALLTTNLPLFKLPHDSVFKSKGFIYGVSVSVVVLLVCVVGLLFYILRQRKRKVNGYVEDWETEYWPHRVQYKDILKATKMFSDKNMIGYGRNSKVYRGLLEGKEVAVKRIMISPHEKVSRSSEFLAEISSLGRLRHKNIVGLRGWCKKGGESLILVYEYMENGSVDKWIFDSNKMFDWEERMRVLRDVASGLLYLHEEWESKVLHRDIKSSNVLLDKEMNARLGDFGMAKLQDTRKEMASTTHIVGTVGYMAPELVKTGRASAETDVYSFGVFVLEVVCGRRPIEEGKEGIVEWIWRLMETERLLDGLDYRIKEKGRFETEKVEMALRLGLFCVHHDQRVRPKMRQVVQILEQGRLSDEKGREGMEVSLLERMNNFNVLGVGEGRQQQHPSFQDMWNSSSHGMSFGSSDTIFQGR